MPASTDLTTRLAALRDLADEVAGAESLPALVAELDDDAVVELATVASALRQAAERVHLVAAGVIGARSSRSAGHSGLAQSLGHRSAVALLQHVTGGTRGEAVRQLRVGESLFDEGSPHSAFDAGDGAAAHASVDATEQAAARLGDPPPPWHAPLRTALMGGTISSAQHDAIRRGLGEPPVLPARPPNPSVVEAWSLAAERLIAVAEQVTVEDLAKHARAIRDLLDPEGAEARYLTRYEARSFRIWTDAEGLSHGSFVFDDESAAWLRSVIDTALRPRRGGPRFVDPAERTAAEGLVNDPRTNEQLAHDLLIDVLKAGTLADAEAVLGTRQAGVRIVQIVNRDDFLAAQAAGQRTLPQRAVTRFEDDGSPLPAAAAARQQCNSSIVPIIADAGGNPLDVGREQRLYTAKQRIALANRDGGCRWNGCDRPASYCEAHHIDEWTAEHGRTDIDRGILLCRFHHMQLHHGGWKITRAELGPFLLHPPPEKRNSRPEGRNLSTAKRTPPAEARPQPPAPADLAEPTDRRTTPIELHPRLPLSYAWQHAVPPPKRFRSAA